MTFHIDGKPADRIVDILRQRGINTSAVSRSSARLDLEGRRLPDLVRASVHYYNSDEELDTLAEALDEIALA